MERNDIVITLEVLRANCSKHSRDYQALDYAISSIKTDLKYDLMYEGEEVYSKEEYDSIVTQLNMWQSEHAKRVLEYGELREKIRTLDEVLQKAQKGITNKDILLGFSMASAICIEYLADERKNKCQI